MCFSLSVWVCAGCVCVCLFIQTDPLRPAERAKTVMCIKLSVFPRSLTTQQRDERSIRVDFHSSRVHPSIRPSLHPCVHPNSIGRSVCWSGECRFGFVEEWLERPLHLHVAHVHRTQLYPIQTHHEPRARLSELQLLLLLLFCPLLLALRLPLLRLVLARRRLACIHGSSSSSSSSMALRPIHQATPTSRHTNSSSSSSSSSSSDSDSGGVGGGVYSCELRGVSMFGFEGLRDDDAGNFEDCRELEYCFTYLHRSLISSTMPAFRRPSLWLLWLSVLTIAVPCLIA
mmetsp:Transcript_23112/g.66226  ORF Transcript_23112/g.66226 Transcript_23112/m.66226 type:complete len:286 (+) Transcript_23112:1307-2164(+)